MAIRATSSSAIRAAKAEGAPRAAATRTLQLDLSSVLAPYRKKHIALRIERIPQRARLSAGRKNGDNSWSLTREDTNDLEYLLPEEVANEHTLAIRIMDLDAAGGSTLALVEYKVSMDNALPAAAPDDDVAEAAAPSNDGEVQQLRDELAKLKASLAAQPAQPAQRDHGSDAKLTAAQVEIAHLKKQLTASAAREAAASEQQEHEIATHLAEARAEFAAELERRMAAATATTASELQRHRAAWQAEFANVQEQWSKDAAAALAAAEQTWKHSSEKALADAEQAWKAAEAKRFADAEQNWKAEEAKRLATREAEWQAQSAKALNEARAATDGEHTAAQTSEVSALKEKLTALEATLADRDLVLAESQKAAEAAQAGSARELNEALVKAEQTWKDAEAKRIAATETEWQAKLTAAAKVEPVAAPDAAKEEELKTLRAQVADAKTALTKAEQDWKAAEAKRFADAETEWQAKLKAATEAARTVAPPPPPAPTNDEELKQLRAQAAQFKTTLADYDAAMAQAQKAAVEAQANTDKKIGEALAAKDAEWQAKLKKAVDDARAEVPPPLVTAVAAPVAASDDVKALRDQIAELETTLIDRDTTIERLEAEAADPKTPTHRDIQDELVKAERVWKAGEAERIAAAQSQARFDQQRALTDAVSRYEQAEAALAHMRIRASDDNRAHNEVTTLRATLGIRESELISLRKQLDDARGYVPPEARGDATQVAEPIAVAAAEQQPVNQTQRYTRDAMIAAAVGVLIVIGYTFFGDLLVTQTPPPAPAAPKVAAIAPAPVVELPKFLISKGAKLRATAEANAEVVERLAVGSEVAELERKGIWSRVRYQADEKAKPSEGWVYASVLKEKPAAPATETAKNK